LLRKRRYFRAAASSDNSPHIRLNATHIPAITSHKIETSICKTYVAWSVAPRFMAVIASEARRTVSDGSAAADNDELDAVLRQTREYRAEIRFHRTVYGGDR
jgi:hypothetical protein